MAFPRSHRARHSRRSSITRRVKRAANRKRLLAGVEQLEERALLAGVPFLNVEGSDGTARDHVHDMTRDEDGNTLIVGEFRTAITFGQGEPNQTSLGGIDAEGYVAKYGLDGSLLWAHSQSGLTNVSGSNESTRGVAVDSNGDVYVTGEMRGDLDADGDGVADIQYRDGYGTFVVKYDANGNLLETLNLPGSDLSRQIEVTDSGIFVSGFFWAGDFDPNPAAETTLDATLEGQPLFVAKYNPDLSFAHVTQFGSLRLDDSFFGAYDKIWSTDVDAQGSIYISGRLDGTQEAGADFDGDGVADTPLGSRSDGFVVKYDADGNFVWVRDIESDQLSVGVDVVVDDSAENAANWKVYWSGGFINLATLGAVTLSSPTGDTDGFLARLNAGTGAAEEVVTFGGAGREYVDGIALAPDGRVFIAGAFDGTVEFGAKTYATSTTEWDAYIAELDPSLAVIDAHQFSSDGTVGSYPVHLDYDPATNLLYAASDFEGVTSFPNGETIASSNNSTDIFVGAFDFTLGSIAGRVYADLDGDGDDDDGVALPDGFSVALYEDVNSDGLLDADDVLLDTTTAAIDSGVYDFGNLAAGDYLVQQTAPSGWSPTTAVAAVALGVDANGEVTTAAANFGSYHPSTVTTFEAPAYATGARIKDSTFNSAFFTINESLMILDLDLTVDVSHAAIEDLQIELEGPADAAGDTTRIRLYNQTSSGADFRGTTFDDDHGISVLSGSAPFSGSFQPVSALRAFDLTDVQGQWTLHVNDYVRNRKQGTLNNWSISVTHLTAPPAEHDVAVTSVSAPESVEPGTDFTVETVVANEGSNAETFNVTLVNSTTQEVVHIWNVALADGEQQTLSTVVSSAGLTEGGYEFTVTADVVPGETDTEDNTSSTVLSVATSGGKGKGGGGGGKPNKLVGEKIGSGYAAPLTVADAERFADIALQLWIDAGHAAQGDAIQIALADLPGNTLGVTDGALITLDVDAAGIGWFVDSTPWESAEFESSPDAAWQHYDLLTAVAHEIGHALGFEHDDDEGVMAATLDVGHRRLPEEETLQAAALLKTGPINERDGTVDVTQTPIVVDRPKQNWQTLPLETTDKPEARGRWTSNAEVDEYFVELDANDAEEWWQL